LNLAENATHNLHNVYPIRGAQVRDSLAWARYINEARDRYAPKVDVLFAQHHWPVWGNARVLDFLAKQRDCYKYLHDQTVRMMSHGLKAAEIAEQLALPASLEREWSLRGYYGTLSHNVKSIYQRYLGWYDANPANLNPHPPRERSLRTVAYMGGAAAIMTRARKDFEGGDYRWVADVMSQVVHAEPENQEARQLAADAYEQLGYQAESATWRNAYLLGAFELRNGTPALKVRAPVSADVINALSLPLFFDYLGVRLNGAKAAGKRSVSNWIFPELGESYVLNLENGVLSYVADKRALDADTTITLGRQALTQIVMRQMTLGQAVDQGAVVIEGDAMKLNELFDLLDEFQLMFPVIEAHPSSAPDRDPPP
jgi:alkyl sulfatase BDS1-like metallo-beta-lactamase superfamily hydrolase